MDRLAALLYILFIHQEECICTREFYISFIHQEHCICRREFLTFFSSLLEALKTGTAFSRDQKRKRAARPAGGKNTSDQFRISYLNVYLSCKRFLNIYLDFKNSVARYVHPPARDPKLLAVLDNMILSVNPG